MAKFTAIVTRNTTESCVIEVEAPDETNAQYQALTLAREDGVAWEQDDTPNMSKDHYVTHCERVEASDG